MPRILLSFLLLTSALYGAVVVRADIDSVVHPVTVEIVSGAIEQAKRENAEIILLRLDTPGGLMDAARRVSQVIGDSPIPVVSYVAPSGARAASAGFFLLLSGDVAAMAPGTRTGAASPVILGKEMDPVMRKKVESDATAWMRSLAARHGRNAELAQKTVTEAQSFTEQEALEAHLIDLVAADESELFRKLNGREITMSNGTKRTLRLASADVHAYRPNIRQTIFRAISDPNLAFIFLVLGALGLYIEFTSPGLIFAGVGGGILLLLGLAAFSVLPITWSGIALLLLAIGFFAAEAFVTSHGVLGVGGAIALVLGALLLVDGPPELRISVWTAIGVGLPFAVIAVFLGSLAVKAHGQKVSTGASGMIDKIGEARTPLGPAGKIFVHGEYWDAISSTPVPEGARVRVLAVDGLQLHVEPLPDIERSSV